ncbi:Hypothetical protein SMAX5B_004117 [Scophthalmus maximus]|uniref:Uncharacterized protein n=1 Tax=Scophthalmus maximus TaxID=52904 RepID=A0A2U9B7V0_SCOMX|nr:Hypothetical protein SMAX5B_004117 [Scophthalmus maximus]
MGIGNRYLLIPSGKVETSDLGHRPTLLTSALTSSPLFEHLRRSPTEGRVDARAELRAAAA